MISVEQNNYSIIVPDFELYENLEMYSLASAIVEGTFKYFKIERIVKNRGRKPLNLLNMTKLLFFASIDKIESSIVIRNEAISNLFYRVFCNEISPSDRSIREFKSVYNVIYRMILSFTLLVAKKTGISIFDSVSNDGTIKLACNSPFNTIKQKDIHLLIKHYMVEELSKKEIKKLRKSARKFLKNNKYNDDEKIEILFKWYDQLELTGQESLPLHDVDARWMKTKDKGQKYKKLAYNVQICTDNTSKLICGINVVQYPSDHYQIPDLLKQTIENLQSIPKILCADTIYGTISNLLYLKKTWNKCKNTYKETKQREY